MTAPGNGILLTVLLVLLSSSTGYAAGRIHQWYRTSLERDEAYRDGYNTATHSLFAVASRMVRARRADKDAIRGTATVTSIRAAPGAVGSGAVGSGAVGSSSTVAALKAPTTGDSAPPDPSARRRFIAAPGKAPAPAPAASAADSLAGAVPTADASTESATGSGGSDAGRRGRHTVPDELVQAATYRLAPDRIARAKVPQPEQTGEKTRMVSLPEPRAS